MSISQSVTISWSLGHGGINQSRNVQIVQNLLNAQMPPSMTKLVADGKSDSLKWKAECLCCGRDRSTLGLGTTRGDQRILESAWGRGPEKKFGMGR